MPNEHDDLEAIRTIVDVLSPFEKTEQERIVRWAFEKLGINIGVVNSDANHVNPAPSQQAIPSDAPTPSEVAGTPSTETGVTDIKSFIASKNPVNDMQFVTAVAYFYAFEAPDESKKAEVGSEDIQDACRLTGSERLANPGQTMRNAAYNGLMDKGSEKGAYKINTVGENLVALTLPSDGAVPAAKKAKKRTSKVATKKKAKKKAATTKKKKKVSKKKK